MKWKVKELLSGKDLETYEAYIQYRNEIEAKGASHWQRIHAMRGKIEVPKVDHVVVYKQPYRNEGIAGSDCQVLLPAPECVGNLMNGYVQPPIEEVWNIQLVCVGTDGHVEVIRKVQETAWIAKHGLDFQAVVDARGIHEWVIEPLSYEKSIEYIIMKDIPVEVWDSRHNSRKFAIIQRHQLPETRDLRNAWVFNEEWQNDSNILSH